MIKKFVSKYTQMPVQIKASIWFLACSFLQKGISIITTPIFTRLMNTAEYGQYNVFNSWLSVLTIIISLNLSWGVYTQGLIKYEDDRLVFSSSMQGLTALLIFAGFVVYFLFKDFWNGIFALSTSQMVMMLAMIWTSAIFGFWASEQRVLYKYKALVAVTLFVATAKPLLGIILVSKATDKVTARIFGLVIVEIAAYIIPGTLQVCRGKKLIDLKFWKYALAYNIPLIPHYLSQTVLNSADRIMIRDIKGETSAGIYSLAYSISLLMTLFNTALSQTVSPWLYKKIKLNECEKISPVAYSLLVFIAMVNLALIAFAPEVVFLFAPEEYREAIYVIPPVAMSVFFMFAYDLFAKFAFYYEKTFFIMKASVGGAVLNVILNFYCIKRFGYIAAGYTTLICYIVFCVAHYYFMNKICKRYYNLNPFDLKVILAITVLFLLIGFSFLFVYNNVSMRYLLICCLLIVCFVFRKKIITAVNTIITAKKNV